MKYYKDPETNEVYAYEADGSQDAYIKPHLVVITDDEANALRAPTPEQLQEARRGEILHLLNDINNQRPEAISIAILRNDKAPLQALEAQAQALNDELGALQ